MFKDMWKYLLLLTAFFMLLEMSFFIQCNKAYLSDFNFVTSQLKLPLSIVPGILYFLFVQLLIHLSYFLVVFFCVYEFTLHFKWNSTQVLYYGILMWLVGILTLLIANQLFYPNSKFSELTDFVSPSMTFYLFMIFTGISGGALLFSCLKIIMRHKFYLSVAMASGMLIYFFLTPSSKDMSGVVSSQPNIILVGVDSLRPDFLSFFGFERKTPFFDNFLNKSAVFSEAITPLARTFPSWTSVLTGQYPRQSGIRFNLAQQHNVDFSTALPFMLRQHGYQTIYATDESRFSNIDMNYGFNEIIAPPMGLNDFLIGNFNDFPLSNLIINTKLGKWLFPYSYANRPVSFAYNPNSFLEKMKSSLPIDHSKPVFLATHFCLPHFPYSWSALKGSKVDLIAQYEASVLRVDKQLSDFFQILKNAGLLNNAVVILISDHGEALELPGDRITEKELFFSGRKHADIPQFYPPSLDDEGINQSAGHGTDVLGLPQYHTVLAFRRYGSETWEPKLISGLVSLLDIKPTLLKFLKLPLVNCSGSSILEAIKGIKVKKLAKHIFLESDYTPEAIRTVYPETRQVLLEGIELFEIDKKTTRLTVKQLMADKIIKSKQYADIYGNWMLALYPQNNHKQIPILINLINGQWTNNLKSKLAKQSPANEMVKQLYAFYGADLMNTDVLN